MYRISHVCVVYLFYHERSSGLCCVTFPDEVVGEYALLRFPSLCHPRGIPGGGIRFIYFSFYFMFVILLAFVLGGAYLAPHAV